MLINFMFLRFFIMYWLTIFDYDIKSTINIKLFFQPWYLLVLNVLNFKAAGVFLGLLRIR